MSRVVLLDRDGRVQVQVVRLVRDPEASHAEHRFNPVLIAQSGALGKRDGGTRIRGFFGGVVNLLRGGTVRWRMVGRRCGEHADMRKRVGRLFGLAVALPDIRRKWGTHLLSGGSSVGKRAGDAVSNRLCVEEAQRSYRIVEPTQNLEGTGGCNCRVGPSRRGGHPSREGTASSFSQTDGRTKGKTGQTS